MEELWFLRSACRQMLIDIYMQFREDSLNGFQVLYSGHNFVTDRHTDARVKNSMSLYPKGRRHNSNSFLSPYEIRPIAQENKYLWKFSYFIITLYVVCTH